MELILEVMPPLTFDQITLPLPPETHSQVVFEERGKSIHLFVILGLRHLLHLVYATLAGGGNAGKVDGNIVATLPVGSRRQRCVC